MFKKLLSYIWTPKPAKVSGFTELTYTSPGSVMAALEHYCAICDRGFQNRGATKTHKRFKHKE